MHTVNSEQNMRGENEPVLVVSCDGHVGPLLREQLRPYCPSQYLSEFDEFAAQYFQMYTALRDHGESDEAELIRKFHRHPNMASKGHYDPDVRLKDMNDDGVVAELIWHFSQNGEPMPWSGHGLGTVTPEQFQLAKVGYQLYNRWLADFCASDPKRLLGVAYLPMWEIEAAIAELEWAASVGLRVVNFPPPGRPGVTEYNSLEWEPFWSRLEETGLVLATHSSGGPLFNYEAGPGARRLQVYEGGGWIARRAVWWLIYGEVFQRHPDLKLVITEQYEGWWQPTILELDSIYASFGGDRPLSKMPSEFMRSNVFLGASFISRAQAEEAYQGSYAQNVLWGRDYPHIEGTWRPRQAEDPYSVTKLSLRHAFSNVPAAEARMMMGENALSVYGLDGPYLRRVATQIASLSEEELRCPPEHLPDVDDSNAFIGQAGPRALEPERRRRLNSRIRS